MKLQRKERKLRHACWAMLCAEKVAPENWVGLGITGQARAEKRQEGLQLQKSCKQLQSRGTCAHKERTGHAPWCAPCWRLAYLVL